MTKPNEYTEYEWSGVKYFPAPGTINLPLVTNSGRKIEYMERTHLEVWVSLNDFQSATQLLRPDGWDVNQEGDEIVLVRPTRAGEYYAIQRVTPFSPYINFADGSQLAAIHLNRFADIDLFRDQELLDQQSSLFIEGGSNDYTLPPATDITLGGVIVGSGLAVQPNGRLSVTFPNPPTPYVLPPATASVLGGIKVGDRLSVTPDGTLSADVSAVYTLPPATTTVLGGVMIGTGLSVTPTGALSVRLNSATNSNSTTEAATPAAVKAANDAAAVARIVADQALADADHANANANTRVQRAGDTMTGWLNMAGPDLGVHIRAPLGKGSFAVFKQGDDSTALSLSLGTDSVGIINGSRGLWINTNNGQPLRLSVDSGDQYYFYGDRADFRRRLVVRDPGDGPGMRIQANNADASTVGFLNWNSTEWRGEVIATYTRIDLVGRQQAWLRAGGQDGWGHAEINGGWREWDAVRFSRGGQYLASIDGNGSYVDKVALVAHDEPEPLSATAGVDVVMALEPVVATHVTTKKPKMGFTKVSLKKAAPHATEDGDGEGTRPMELIPVLVKAVQELVARIDALEARLP